MPIHDWTRVEAGDFHHFHQRWIQDLAAALNTGGLPPEYMALAEQVTGRPIPDVVALRTREPRDESGGVALQSAPPAARVVQRLERASYARRQDRVVIRHRRGVVVAIIEIVSPGNKSSGPALRAFVEKASDILNQGIHLLVVDLFPPTARDPQGIHQAIWNEFDDEPFDFLPEKPLTAVSYVGGDLPTAYVDSLAVGDDLPAKPIYLTPDEYVPAPLEATYMQAWGVYPVLLRDLIEGR